MAYRSGGQVPALVRRKMNLRKMWARGFIVVSVERNEQDRVSSLVWIISVGSRAQRICLVVWPFDH